MVPWFFMIHVALHWCLHAFTNWLGRQSSNPSAQSRDSGWAIWWSGWAFLLLKSLDRQVWCLESVRVGRGLVHKYRDQPDDWVHGIGLVLGLHRSLGSQGLIGNLGNFPGPQRLGSPGIYQKPSGMSEALATIQCQNPAGSLVTQGLYRNLSFQELCNHQEPGARMLPGTTGSHLELQWLPEPTCTKVGGGWFPRSLEAYSNSSPTVERKQAGQPWTENSLTSRTFMKVSLFIH